LPVRVANLFAELVGSYVRSKFPYDLISTSINEDMYDREICFGKNIELINKRIASAVIPDIYFPDLITNIPLEEYFKIRNDLLPLRKDYLGEIEKYKNEINTLMSEDNINKAYELLDEFHLRVNDSFHRYSYVLNKTIKFLKKTKANIVLNGFLLLSGQIFKTVRYYDYLQLFFTIFNSFTTNKKISFGFDYLTELHGKLVINDVKRKLNIFKKSK